MDFQRLEGIGCEYKTKVNLKNYTTFKVGGECDVMLFPKTKEEYFGAIDALEGTDYCVLGAGSNVLISDEGFCGAVISTLRLNKIRLSGCLLEAECGAKLISLVRLASESCYGGLEFAASIPGTVGGLAAMNGGCFNKNIGDLVFFVKAKSGVYSRKNCEFGYRTSRFLHNKDAIYSVGLHLSFSERDIIEQKLEHFSSMRNAKQPKGNSCGSVFMNNGIFAGKLIDQVGLKGYRIGGAVVSDKHANFIINDNGTASDIYRLIKYVKETVLKKTGVELKEEVRYIGNFYEDKF